MGRIKQKQSRILTQSDTWMFGNKPTEKILVWPDPNYIFGLGDVSKIRTIDVFDKFFTNPIEEKEYPGMDITRMISEPAFIWMASKILLGITLHPLQAAAYAEVYKRPFPILLASRGFAKSFGLALILTLKAALTRPVSQGGPGMQAVIVGSGFRQSKIVFEYLERIWKNAPVLRSICNVSRGYDGPHREQDRFTMTINGNNIIAIPLGDGEKIRGLRCTIICSDEHNSIPEDIFDTVVKGFASVSSDPIGNMEYYRKIEYLRSINDVDGLREVSQAFQVRHNQIITSGTAGYQFQPMFKIYKKYRAFIESQGDILKLKQSLPEEEIPEGFDYKDYSIVRIPYEYLEEHGKGFMDSKVVANAKATMGSDKYLNEFGTIFTADSTGFFKMSNVHRNTDRYELSSVGDKVGSNNCLGHLFGVDVASEFDKFAIVVLAIYGNHAKVVNTWSTDRKTFEERQKLKLTDISDYYGFCVRKLRDLMRQYPPMVSHPMGACIACDVGGGGVAIRESLHDLDKIQQDEDPIYEIIEPGSPKNSDIKEGNHCLFMVDFSNRQNKNDLYYGTNKLLQDGKIKFPFWDAAAMEKAMDADAKLREKFMDYCEEDVVLFDTIEDNYTEIYKMIDELCSIKVTRSPSGTTEVFKTESSKGADGKKIYKHKDRATGLLLASLLYQRFLSIVDPITILDKHGKGKRHKRSQMFELNSPLAAALNGMDVGFDAANRILGVD